MSETTAQAIHEPKSSLAQLNDEPPFGHVPDHTELPYEDGTFVKNFQEHPQSLLLTDSILPVLQKLHPDGQFAIGQDSGIYWQLTTPYLDGATAPDWFYIPNVPPLVDGEVRRSYVLWRETIAPLIIIEFVSATDGGERDRTPKVGKFWIYEQAVRAPFYAIYEVKKGLVDVYHLVDGRYQPVAPNERKHFPLAGLGVELGIWRGHYINQTLPWLRWWDLQGNLLPTSEERAEQEAKRAEQEAQRAQEATERAEQATRQAAIETQRADEATQRAALEAQRTQRLIEQLRALGIDPDKIS